MTFENMREPVRLQVSASRPAISARNVRADSVVPFPSGSVPRRAPLESLEIRAAAVNIFLVASAFLFVLVTALASVAGFFFLLFGNF
jgi:hypothetical protein